MTDPLYRAGSTALLAVVPEAEPALHAFRERYDASAAAGVPAHVTILVPFLDESRVDDAVHDALAGIIGGFGAFDVAFGGFGRFPDVLYLRPEPEEPFRALTAAIALRFPETPPYGGVFADVIPHLTVAHGQPAELLDDVAALLAPDLPIVARVSAVQLLVCDGHRWTASAAYPLKG
jgi:2'-5' RNA ligase